MHIHEYEAKTLLNKYNIPSPPHFIVSNIEEVKEIVQRHSLNQAVIKVQIHAGGRGKAGGIKYAKNKEEIIQFSKELLGKKIINSQTGPLGLTAHKLLITKPVSIKREFYVAALIDRAKASPYLIASKEGGMDIEEIAEKKPSAIIKEKIALSGKIRNYQLYTMCEKLGWEGDIKKQGISLLTNLAKLFTESDATLFEINPLIETEEGQLLALDAKCTLDDNALFRHKEFEQFYDPTQSTPNEVLANKFSLSFVGLDGDIGCIVNGAGLAMATMDILKYYGGKAANFLDVGGSASIEKISQGFKILLKDTGVKVIFVNIFGGIMDCSIIAKAAILAIKEEKIQKPLVIRLEGTNADLGKEILKKENIPFFAANTMALGANEAVNLVQNQK